MALYTNVGGAPGTLVAYTAATSLSGCASGAAVEMNVVGGSVALPAGTYWLMINLSGGAYLGNTTVGAAANVTTYNGLPFNSAFPATFGTPLTYLGQFHDHYLVVH